MAKEEEKKTQKARKPTAVKRMLQNEKSRIRNKGRKSQIRTAIRQFEKSLEEGQTDQAKKHLNSVFSLVDKAVKSGVYKKNKANRTKSRLTARTQAKA